MDSPIRRTVLYTGRVQGVGFRYTTCSVAEGFAVTGTVRNLPDGRVELIAEGAAEELDRFCRAVAARLSPFITDMQVNESPGTGSFAGFAVAY